MSEENRSLQDIDENEARAILWAARISDAVELDSISEKIKIKLFCFDELNRQRTFEIDSIKRISFQDLQPIIEFQIDKRNILMEHINLLMSLTIHYSSMAGLLTIKYPYARCLNAVITENTNENIDVKLGIYFGEYCIINEIPFGIINYPEGKSLQIIDECFATAKDFVEFGAK
jgi:hypothetical protein